MYYFHAIAYLFLRLIFIEPFRFHSHHLSYMSTMPLDERPWTMYYIFVYMYLSRLLTRGITRWFMWNNMCATRRIACLTKFEHFGVQLKSLKLRLIHKYNGREVLNRIMSIALTENKWSYSRNVQSSCF